MRRLQKLCGIPGCDRKHQGRGRCARHYMELFRRERRHREPGAPRLDWRSYEVRLLDNLLDRDAAIGVTQARMAELRFLSTLLGRSVQGIRYKLATLRRRRLEAS